MTRHKLLAICLDCGDTLVDESTEIKTDGDVSLRADLIPGADELMHELKRRGYPLALVADGPTATFPNNLGPYGLYELFDAYAISQAVGVTKPDPAIFHHALNQLDIAPSDSIGPRAAPRYRPMHRSSRTTPLRRLLNCSTSSTNWNVPCEVRLAGWVGIGKTRKWLMRSRPTIIIYRSMASLG